MGRRTIPAWSRDLRRQRKEFKLSLRQLGKISGIPPPTLHNWEQGKRKDPPWEQIARLVRLMIHQHERQRYPIEIDDKKRALLQRFLDTLQREQD